VKPFVLALATIAVLALGGSSIAMPGNASFVDQAQDGGNTLATDTLSPPTGLSATSGASISLSWTATTDTYAAGHRIFRATASGGPYSQIAQVTPRTNTTYVDSPSNGTYYYLARAYYQSWESVNSSQVSALAGTIGNTGFLNCSAQAAVTVASGDNDGYQQNPASACTNEAGFAFDEKSGTGSIGNCADAGKDRHVFYNYGVTAPAGSQILGIEVRLDAWTESTTGSPFLCVELSWNNGASWTAVKTTSTLTTGQMTYTLGSASDLWGRSWSISDLSNSNFRLRVTNVAASGNRDFNLDWVAVRATYVAP
jgi:hypothetical protein